MRRLLLTLFMAGLILGPACSHALAGSPVSAAPEPKSNSINTPVIPDDAIIARVNGEAILLSQLKEAALDQEVPVAAVLLAGAGNDGYRRAMTQLIDETLLVQKANLDSIKVNDQEIAKQVDEMLSTLRTQLGSQENLDVFLKRQHLTLVGLRSLMTERERRRMLVTELIARRVAVDAGTIEKYVQARKAKGEPLEEVRLAQILIACSPEERGSSQGKERYKLALQVAREVESNRARFPELVKEYSEDPASAARDGDLGWVDPQSLLPELSTAVRKMESGGISTPILSEKGYHILLLLGRHNTRDLAYGEGFAQARTRLIEQLRQDASIRLYDLLSGKPVKDAAAATKQPDSK